MSDLAPSAAIARAAMALAHHACDEHDRLTEQDEVA